MLNDIYYVNLEFTGYSWIIIAVIFCIYNGLIIYFAPEIKQYIKTKIPQESIGFKLLGKHIGFK